MSGWQGLKELYFTDENIRRISEDILSRLSIYRRKHDLFRLDPERTALLVIDMQEWFLDSSLNSYIPSASTVKKNIIRLIRLFEREKLNIIYTRHINTPRDAKMISRWWKSIITEDNVHSCISDGLLAEDPVIIEKTQYDAFYGTGLEDHLNASGISQLVITGLMTNVCCDATARSGFARGFEVFMVVDGMAAHSYDLHFSSLLSLSHCCAVPINTENIINLINTGNSGND